MPVLKVKNNGVWEDVFGTPNHTHEISEITDFPTPTTDDNGKFLRVVNGVPKWESITDVSEVGS